MPISDLLASISGPEGKGSPPSASVLKRPPSAIKRKADDDLRPDISKAPRSSGSTPKPLQQQRSSDRPALSQRPTAGQSTKPSAASTNRGSYATVAGKPTVPARSAAPMPANGTPTAKPPPKKGSFAEIMARGQRAQASMGQVGRIQHKKVAKSAQPIKKDEGATTPRSSKELVKGVSTGYKGSARPLPRDGANGRGQHAVARDGRGQGARPGVNGSRTPPGNVSAKQQVQQEEQRKIKKAAQATTGYAGTARPKPGNSTKKKSEASRGGALLNRPAPRSAASRHSQYEDDYDEELDDFIDYDDEEDDGGGGPRYEYASDASSDMEAGLDELDVEERAAERIARQEDIEEERRERSLKMAKEERKRKALEALRAGKRR